jgi:3-hydroxybutyryl-CoA dehydratase
LEEFSDLAPPHHNEHIRLHTFTQHQVDAFVALTGDGNSIHQDSNGDAVVPGILLASLFPAIIGSKYPGAIYVSQDLKFKKKVLVGEEVRAHVEITKQLQRSCWFKTTCYVQDRAEGHETIAVAGAARAIMPKKVM